MLPETRMQRRYILLTAFLLPVLAMLFIFAQRGIYPFGEESFLRTDLYHQYAPFFSEFQHKLRSGESLFYSWDVGLGVNFSAIYAYYLASPLNWLIVLCPKRHIIEFITAMVVLKTGLCGLTMTSYLLHHSREKRYFAALFGSAYALSAYMAAYSWNVMWLDCILLFPLICLAMERLMEGQSCIPYTLLLALCIGSNYYISIMICLFLLLYAAAWAVLKDISGMRLVRAAGRFALCSIIAGGLAAVILLPEVFALQSTASGSFHFPKSFESYFSILDMLARHMGNIDTEIGLDHWPNLYCGVAVYQLVLLYIANRRISLKEKAVYGLLLMFFLASFSINVLNYIWHGFHYPNSLPARQSFIYIFLVLFISYRAAEQWRGNTRRDMALAFLLSSGFILLCQEFVDQKHFYFWSYYAALGLTALYALLFRLIRMRHFERGLMRRVLTALVGLELCLNFAISSVPTTSRTEYTADNADIISLRDSAPRGEFVRFEKIRRKSKDDGAWLNFPSVSLFSSTADKALSDFLRDLGCESSVNAYSITGSTPLVDALLDVKYAFYPEESYNRELKLISQSGTSCLYEYPSTFPLGFLVNADFTDCWVRTLENPADVQNDLCALMNCGGVLDEVAGTEEGRISSFTADTEGEYYVFVGNARVDAIQAELPGITRSFDNLKRRYFAELGTLHPGDRVTLENKDENSSEHLDARIYRFNYNSLRELREKLVTAPLTLTEFSDGYLKGTVTAERSGLLFCSIPFDEGWQITVDGVSTKAERCMDAFLSVRLPAGTHELEFRYVPRGLKYGALLSLLMLLCFAGLLVYERKRRSAEPGEDVHEEDSQESGLFSEEALSVAEQQLLEGLNIPVRSRSISPDGTEMAQGSDRMEEAFIELTLYEDERKDEL